MPDIAVAHSVTPFVSVYPWTPGTGFGVKYANPATVPTGTSYGVAFCGWTHIWTHIAKVNGVTAAAIAKINGVLKAAIAKINGIAV